MLFSASSLLAVALIALIILIVILVRNDHFHHTHPHTHFFPVPVDPVKIYEFGSSSSGDTSPGSTPTPPGGCAPLCTVLDHGETIDFTTNTGFDTFNQRFIAVQSDGSTLYATDSAATIRRLTPTGAIDGSFTNYVFPGGTDVRHAILQPDDKILLALHEPGVNEYRVARLNADGTPDTAFATGGVYVAQPDQECRNSCLKLQVDGKILVGGDQRGPPFPSERDASMYRLNADGTLDTTFATAGYFLLASVDPVSFDGFDIEIDSSGDIIFMIHEYVNVYTTKLSPAGVQDLSYGTGGLSLEIVRTGIIEDFLSPDHVCLDSNDNLLIAGVAGDGSGGSLTNVYMLDNNGVLVPTFGVGGILSLRFTLSGSVAGDFDTPAGINCQCDDTFYLSGWSADSGFTVFNSMVEKFTYAGVNNGGLITVGEYTTANAVLTQDRITWMYYDEDTSETTVQRASC